MKYCYILLFVLLSGLSCAAQTNTKIVTPPVKLTTNEQIFPFKFNEVGARYDLMINLKDPKIIKKYKTLFQKHKLKFEGYTWQEVVSQIMEKVDPYLARDIDYMDGDDELYISTGGKKDVQKEFMSDLLMVLLNNGILESYLKKLDRTRLDDVEQEQPKLDVGRN